MFCGSSAVQYNIVLFHSAFARLPSRRARPVPLRRIHKHHSYIPFILAEPLGRANREQDRVITRGNADCRVTSGRVVPL